MRWGMVLWAILLNYHKSKLDSEEEFTPNPYLNAITCTSASLLSGSDILDPVVVQVA